MRTESFTAAVPQTELDELADRVRRARWPEAATDPSQGIALERVRALCDRWTDGYDWRRVESELNRWPQLRAELFGLGIHVVHARSPHPHARPLVLTHGWPGSVLEYRKLVGPLTDPPAFGGDPADAFHVVVPSLPGYGFSDRPDRPGWSIERIAEAWASLMASLGYDRYLAMGSDWGTSVTTLLGQHDRVHLAGVHLVPPLAPPDPADEPTPWERQALADLHRTTAQASAYTDVHRTRPQTIGYALVDSPVALCAWLAEKYDAWSDPSGGLTDDDILDAATLYWVTGTGASAARLYWQSIDTVASWFTADAGDPVDVPVGASVFDHEVPRVSRRWAQRRFPDIRVWRHHERGGHFAGLEVPELLVADIREFARIVW